MASKHLSYYFMCVDQQLQCCICGQCFDAGARLSVFENHMIFNHSKIGETIPDLKIKIERNKAIEQERINKMTELTREKKEKMEASFAWNHFTQDDNNKLTCNYCGKVYDKSIISNGDRYYRMHILVHHGDKVDPEILQKYTNVEKCSYCDKIFQFACNRLAHEHKHIKKYACDKCGKIFSTKKDIKRHERVHSGEKPYECTTCGKKFAQQTQVKSHTRVHTGETPYQCFKCGKNFKFLSSRDNHKCV